MSIATAFLAWFFSTALGSALILLFLNAPYIQL